MVFHVTKRGDSVMVLSRCEVRLPTPMGVNEPVDESGVVAVVDGARDMEEFEDGVEVPLLADIRDRAGLRGIVELFGVSPSSASSSCSSSESPASELASSPFGYSAHEVWTWWRVIGVRFSRLALRASKQ